MGWGNPTPMANLKRRAAQVNRLKAERDEARALIAQALTACDEASGDHIGGVTVVRVPTIRAALTGPARCATCISAYVECPVHA